MYPIGTKSVHIETDVDRPLPVFGTGTPTQVKCTVPKFVEETSDASAKR